MSKRNLIVSKKQSRGKRVLLVLAVGILVLGALIIWGAKNTDTADPDANNPNILTISTGTQGRFEDLSIGLGNIQNNSANIYIHQNGNGGSTSKKVVVGDQLEIYGYKIEVKSISNSWNPSRLIGASHGSIKLLVTRQ